MNDPKPDLALFLEGFFEGQERPMVSVLPAWVQRHRAEKILELARFLLPDLTLDLEIRAGRWVILASKLNRPEKDAHS
jgi:hypothetical protein